MKINRDEKIFLMIFYNVIADIIAIAFLFVIYYSINVMNQDVFGFSEISASFPYSISIPEFGSGWDDFVKNIFLVPLQFFYTYELPGSVKCNLNWYCSLAIAYVVQFYISHLCEIIENIWLEYKIHILYKFFRGLIFSFLFSGLSTHLAYIMILMLFPYNSPILLILFCAIVLCFPIILFKFLRKRLVFEDENQNILNYRKFFFLFVLFNLKVFFSIYIASHHFASLIILFFLNLLQFFINDPNGAKYKRYGKLKQFILFLFEGIVISGCFILAYSLTIKNAPEIEFCDLNANRLYVGRSGNIIALQQDGNALDEFGMLISDEVQQVIISNNGTYFLGTDCQLYTFENKKKIGVLENITWISSYKSQILAVDKKGDVWFWGGDFSKYASDGVPFYLPKKILSDMEIVKAEIGKNHILLLDAYGNLYSMGRNYNGVLGIGSSVVEMRGIEYVMPDVIEISAGMDVSYALTKEGVLYGWGRNEVFQLGVGDNKSRNLPEYIMNNVKQINIGFRCGYAIDNDNQLWVWGDTLLNKNKTKKPCIFLKNVAYIAENECNNGLLRDDIYYVGDDCCVYRSGQKIKYSVVTDKKIELPMFLESINSFVTLQLDQLNTFFEKSLIEQQPLYNQEDGNETGDRDRIFGYEGHSYQYFEEGISWEEAKQNCENMGGHLLTITSEQEQEFIEGIIRLCSDNSLPIGIGLYYDQDEWTWITGEEMIYKKDIRDHIEGIMDLPSYDASDLPYGTIDRGEWKGVGKFIILFDYVCEWDYLIEDAEIVIDELPPIFKLKTIKNKTYA